MELILALLLEGTLEAGTDTKLSKWIRYPLLLLGGSTYAGFITLFIIVGLSQFEDELVGHAIAMWVFALAFTILTILIFRNAYKAYMKKKSKGRN